MSVKCALKGRPEGAGFGLGLHVARGDSLCWPSICCAEAQSESRTNERRVIVMRQGFRMTFYYRGGRDFE